MIGPRPAQIAEAILRPVLLERFGYPQIAGG